ncbi:MAG: ATP-binding protein, partial [Gammaproteobacteria bacterium]
AQLNAARANPNSNIPEQYLAFKALLAESIQAPADALAYVAELVAVKEEQSDWRGAIERAIGAQRLRLIIPAEHMQPALAWVNQRDNRINIRLLDAGHYAGRQAANFFSDGYTHKLQFAKHPLREAAKHFLAEHDLHCVADTHALHHTEHALTREGMISGRRGRFEKMDARRLNEGWCTGFDNHDLVSQLEEQLLEATRKARQASQQLKQAKQALTEADQQQAMLEALANLEFSRLDVQGAQNTLDYLERQLVELQSPGSKAELARQAWEQAKQASQAHQEKITEQATTLSRLQAEIEYAQRQIKLFLKQRGAGLNEEQRALVERRYRQPETKDLEGIIELQREAEQGLTTPIERAEEDLRRIDNRLVRLMSTAKQLDTGALAEAGTDLEDIPQYLNQLEVLTKEALPAKRERFLSYLNKSSDEGVTQLLTHIDTEVAAIEERIEELNQTLVRVDYRPGHYLQLAPRRVEHNDLNQVKKAQKALRAAELKDDQGESHYRALMHLVGLLRNAVDKPKTVGAQALLDPRHRLQFRVEERDRQSGEVLHDRGGSQGGSGGEKEIIASYVLTASLSYALCPDGLSHPLFGTVVLDEAFSRSSQAFARRIVEALREFNLHPLFVTPNKEMRLLRDHTRSAVLVHRRDTKASTVTLSWEEIDAKTRERKPPQPPSQ